MGSSSRRHDHGGRSRSPSPAPGARASSSSALIDGFFFRRRRERLNWRMLAAIDPDQVMKDVRSVPCRLAACGRMTADSTDQVDIESLQEVMENVTFCDIEAEDVRYIDPNFIKLFQLAQLIIEFLLHSQEYLVDQRDEAEAELESLRGRYAKAASEQEKQEAESAAMKKELKTLRKTLYAYQLVAKLPGGLSQNNTTQAVYHAASSVEFQRMADMIERFSTRLVDAERQLRQAALQLRLLFGGMLTRCDFMRAQAALEEMYKQERLRYERELQELKTSVHKQVNDEREALLEEKARFEEYMNRELKRKSHVGQIEDDDDGAAKRAAREPPPKQEPEEQPKPAKTDEIGAEVQRLLQQLAEQQARSQREQESTALSLAAEFDARQQDALEAVQERMAAEMERIRLTLIEQHNDERRTMEEQLQAATREIQEMRAAMQARRSSEAKPKQPTPPHSAQEDADNHPRLPSLTIKIPQPPEPESAPVSQPQSARSEPTPPPLEPTFSDEILMDVEAIAEAAKSTGSMDIPKEDPQTEDELWETVVDAMRKHTETPIQSAPWAKSLFAHPVGAIQDEKNNSSTLADQYLAERGVTSSRIYKEWGINPGIFGEYSELSMQMFAERMQDGDAMPMYKRMRSHLEKQVDSIVSVYLAKAQDPSSTISRRSSMRKASLAFSLGPAPSPNRGSTAGALRRSIQINPVQKVEVFDQSLPVVSPVKRMSFSMPAVGFAATPTASEHGRSHERRASTTTSASTATEGPDDLDVLRAQLAALRASAQSPGSAHKQSFFSNPFKKISGDIARRLFSPKADGQMPSLREEHEAANAGNEQVFEPLEQLPPSPLKKNGTPLKGFFGRIGDLAESPEHDGSSYSGTQSDSPSRSADGESGSSYTGSTQSRSRSPSPPPHLQARQTQQPTQAPPRAASGWGAEPVIKVSVGDTGPLSLKNRPHPHVVIDKARLDSAPTPTATHAFPAAADPPTRRSLTGRGGQGVQQSAPISAPSVSALRSSDGGGDDDDVGIDDLEISSSSLSQEDSLLESIIDEDPIPSNQSSPQYVGTVPAKVIGQATGTAPSSSWTAPAAKGGVAGFDNDDDDDDMDIFDNLPDSDSLTEDPPAAAAGRTSVQMPRPPQPVSNTAAAKPPPPAAQGWAGPPQGVHVMDDLDDFDD
ncbi:hypothetical protein HK105_208350 [Polyrhizophydium stewartii]|uniref:Cilium assembly protein DZIP1 N-terminal domain-containing protein n=1 Tax=Polyrhizophydium stewartii TaxID=2732419 RepID=A0ABR4MY22_9FUNG